MTFLDHSIIVWVAGPGVRLVNSSSVAATTRICSHSRQGVAQMAGPGSCKIHMINEPVASTYRAFFEVGVRHYASFFPLLHVSWVASVFVRRYQRQRGSNDGLESWVSAPCPTSYKRIYVALIRLCRLYRLAGARTSGGSWVEPYFGQFIADPFRPFLASL